MALRKLLVDPASQPLRRDWRGGLPEIRDATVTLRELRDSDARSLMLHLNQPRVLRYITPCPVTLAGFVRFIRWTRTERRRGAFACYGIVPAGERHAVGVLQFWPVERDFSTGEWGFALSERYWGTGLFKRSASLALDTVFAQLGVYRLEARSVDTNLPGNRALENLGAIREGVLRGSFRDGRVVRNHVMWSILAPAWRARRRGRADAH